MHSRRVMNTKACCGRHTHDTTFCRIIDLRIVFFSYGTAKAASGILIFRRVRLLLRRTVLGKFVFMHIRVWRGSLGSPADANMLLVFWVNSTPTLEGARVHAPSGLSTNAHANNTVSHNVHAQVPPHWRTYPQYTKQFVYRSSPHISAASRTQEIVGSVVMPQDRPTCILCICKTCVNTCALM